MMQQVDQKILPRPALRQNADHVGDAAKLFQKIDCELTGENNVANPGVPLELRRFHPHRTLQTRFIQEKVAFVLRLRAFHGEKRGHGEAPGAKTDG